MDFQQLLQVELWCLQNLALSNSYILKREDTSTRLLDLLSDDFRNKLVDQLLQVTGGSVLLHDLDHLGSDLSDLSRLSVAASLNLVHSLLSEGNAEKSKVVVISGLDINVGLNKSLPLADQGAKLICGEVHSVELSQAVLALNVVALQLDLPVGLVLVLVQVRETDLVDSSLEPVGRNLGTLSTRDESLPEGSRGEHGWSLQAVPVLLREGIHAKKGEEKEERGGGGQTPRPRAKREEEERHHRGEGARAPKRRKS